MYTGIGDPPPGRMASYGWLWMAGLNTNMVFLSKKVLHLTANLSLLMCLLLLTLSQTTNKAYNGTPQLRLAH